MKTTPLDISRPQAVAWVLQLCAAEAARLTKTISDDKELLESGHGTPVDRDERASERQDLLRSIEENKETLELLTYFSGWIAERAELNGELLVPGRFFHLRSLENGEEVILISEGGLSNDPTFATRFQEELRKKTGRKIEFTIVSPGKYCNDLRKALSSKKRGFIELPPGKLTRLLAVV